MLFYTSITTAQLPQAKALGEALQAVNPNAKLHIVLCDELPASAAEMASHFGSILCSKDFPAPHGR